VDRYRWRERVALQQPGNSIPRNGPFAATLKVPYPPDAGRDPAYSKPSNQAACDSAVGEVTFQFLAQCVVLRRIKQVLDRIPVLMGIHDSHETVDLTLRLHPFSLQIRNPHRFESFLLVLSGKGLARVGLIDRSIGERPCARRC
jgi:hypothetical protein